MIVKFISNVDAILYIDQERVASLTAGTICKFQLELGSYLLEVVPIDNTISAYVEDFELLEEKQTLKRIEFIANAPKNDKKSINHENADTFPEPYDYNERGIAVGKRYDVERFITRDGKIWIVNDIKQVSEKNAGRFVLNSDCYDWCGRLHTSQKMNGSTYLPVVKDEKWGVCLIEKNNSPKLLVPCIYDKVLSVYADWDLITFQKENYNVLVNLNGRKYSRNHELSGQYLVAPIGEELCKIKCEELYPVVRVEKDFWLSEFSMRVNLTEYFYPYSVIAIQDGKYGLSHLRSMNPIFLYDDLFSKSEDGTLTRIYQENVPIIARKGNFLGLVNANGLELTSFVYNDIYFVGEIIAAKKGNKYSLLDKGGMELMPLLFDNIHYKNDNYIVESDGKCGVYSFSNNALMIPCEFESISLIEHYVKHTFTHDTVFAFLCIKDEKKGIYDKEGKLLLECKYEEISLLESGITGITDYNGYILKQNNSYGWWTNYDGRFYDFIYDSIECVTEGNDQGYLIVKKNSKYGCYTFYGVLVFDVEYDLIKYLGGLYIGDDYHKCFLCSQKGKTYLKDETNKIYNVLEYDEIIPYTTPYSGMLYFVKKNGSFGIINDIHYPAVLIEYIYDSLNILAIGNKYLYACGSIKGKKYIIVSPFNWLENNKRFEVECDEIYPVLDSIGKEYIHSRYHKDYYGFVYVKDGKHGIIGLDGEILVPSLYDEVVQIEKNDNEQVEYYITRQNNKLAVFDIKRRCIIPPIYQKIIFKKNYFLVSNDNFDGIYSLDGRCVLPCVFSKYVKLGSNKQNAYQELKKNPHSNNFSDEIPITIWEAEYNTYVAFNSESGTIIVANPMPFEEIMPILEKYKENYLKKLK